MKLVIDIHEGDYRYIKQLKSITMARGTCKTIQRDVINAIKNGIPYEERPNGKWIEDKVAFYIGCPHCMVYVRDNHDVFLVAPEQEVGFHYCPNCGAILERRAIRCD